MLAVADGVSASAEARQASHTCLSSLIADYYSTPDSWTVRHAAARVIDSLNRWLYHQGSHLKGCFYPQEQSDWCTTLTACIIKSVTAHIIHTGDSRAWLYRDGKLEPLTQDHTLQAGKHAYLSKALGMAPAVEVDYKTLSLELNDVLLLTTDGIHDVLSQELIAEALVSTSLDKLCQQLVSTALKSGSRDNVTALACKVIQLPLQTEQEQLDQLTQLPFPPDLYPGQSFEGFYILEQIHGSKRSQLYLANDLEQDRQVILKTPSVNYEDDPTYIEGFIREEWIGRRSNHPAIMTIYAPSSSRSYLYHVCEYIKGQTLRDWMQDNPKPSLITVRDIIRQTISAVRSLHRLQVLHQDLKPENLMIDEKGRVRLIDFGSVRIAGESHLGCSHDQSLSSILPQGTKNYIAPEYFSDSVNNGAIDERADQFAIGVIAYELLTGGLPYKEQTGSIINSSHYRQLNYHPVSQHRNNLPDWIDFALTKATKPSPAQRYPALSEFMQALNQPDSDFTKSKNQPLMERNPTLAWQIIASILLLLNVLQLLN